MRRTVLVLLPLLAAGCGGSGPAARNDAAPGNTAAADILPLPGNAALPTPTASASPAQPPGNAGAEASAAPESAEAAAAVVRSYYALLESGEYALAQALWDDGADASKLSADAFAGRFDGYAEYRAEVGAPGRIDAGAGQRYVEVPVRVHGRLKEGDRAFETRGRVVLHRAADIPGATEEQRRWRIREIDLESNPAAAASRPDTITARYRCVDGSRMTARFDNGAGTVTITRDGKELSVLEQQRAASGIWYRGGGYVLRGKGSQATFSAPDRAPVPCTAA